MEEYPKKSAKDNVNTALKAVASAIPYAGGPLSILFETIFSSQGSTPQNMGLSQKEIFWLFNLHSPQGPISGVA